MEPKVTADVLAVCNTLGYTDGKKYFPDPQCLGSAKDLVLFLRRDTEDHDIRRLLGEAQVVQRDLIPVFRLADCTEDLSEMVLRLMVNLTNPTLLLYEEKLPKSKDRQNHFITITRHLQAYKVAFVDEAFWRVVSGRLGKLIENMETLLENQKLTVERILILIRNVLQIPADPGEEMRNDDDMSVHDKILSVLHKSGVQDWLLHIASTDGTREFCMHIIEIISLFFREQTGEQLAQTSSQPSEADRVKDARELVQTVQMENLMRARKQVSTRTFGGTFVVRGLKAPSGNNLLCHKPVQSISDLSLDRAKQAKKTPVNRREVVEQSQVRRSTLTMRLFLKNFCLEFLSRAYNSLMRIVKDHLTRRRGQEHDDTYYLLALRFFMEFNRFRGFRGRLVSETMNTATFHYVQVLIAYYHELMVTDKENLGLWSKRAHTALRAYQELLASLAAMERSPGGSEGSRTIQATIFYLPEYRELCVGLLASYDAAKLSRNYLCDLIETNHLFLKMLEGFSREKKLLVRGKKRGRKTKGKGKRKPKKRLKKKTEGDWAPVEEGLAQFLSTDYELEETIPFDAASDTPIDEQTPMTLSRISSHLGSQDFNKAVSLLRAAREVWPDADQLSAETEILALRSIFLEALPLPVPDNDDDDVPEEEDEEAEIDEEEDEDRRPSGNDTEFDFRGFIERYANSKIVANYGNLFKHYSTLQPLQLHCILKMFHRYAFDLGYPALLCQASIFKTFQSLLKVAQVRDDLKEASKFFIHFWSKFMKMAESNPKIFIELLFWKNAREATEIQEGYASYSTPAAGPPKKKKNSRKVLSEEEENEVIVLAEEYARLDEPAMKQVDWINEKIIAGPKIKKVITNFLAERGLLAKNPKRRRRTEKGAGPGKKQVGKDPDPRVLLDSDSSKSGSGSGSDSSDENEDEPRRPVIATFGSSDSDSDGGTSQRPSQRQRVIPTVDSDDDENAASVKPKPGPGPASEGVHKGPEKRMAMDDSDDDDLPRTHLFESSDSENEAKSTPKPKPKPTERKRVIATIDSDEDDNDTAVEPKSGEATDNNNGKPTLDSDNEGDYDGRRNHMFDSSDSDNEGGSSKKPAERRRVIRPVDSDEDEPVEQTFDALASGELDAANNNRGRLTVDSDEGEEEPPVNHMFGSSDSDNDGGPREKPTERRRVTRAVDSDDSD